VLLHWRVRCIARYFTFTPSKVYLLYYIAFQVATLQTFFICIYHSSQGLGVPTGPHGAFRDYQVDAITLEISPKVSPTKMIRRNEFILRGGRYVSLI
jgi:hypothetical protein